MKKRHLILITVVVFIYLIEIGSLYTGSSRHNIKIDETMCAKPIVIEPIIIEPVEIIEYEPIIEVEYEPVTETNEELIVDAVAHEPEWGFDFNYVCRVVAAESRGEPYEGQVAVAQCIWNTAVSRGLTPVEVVNMPNRYADPVSEELVTDSVRDACRNAFLGIDLVTEEPIEYFYSTANGFVSKWHESALEHVITIGNHKFFKVK